VDCFKFGVNFQVLNSFFEELFAINILWLLLSMQLKDGLTTEKKRKLVPAYFVNRRNSVIQVFFATLFAYGFINIYRPFGADEWYDVTWWLFSLVSGLLVFAGMLVILISRVLMFWIKRRRPVSALYYILMVTSEVLLMGILYAVLERIVLGNVRPFGALIYMSIQNTSLILLIPYTISLLFFAWQENKMSLEALLAQLTRKPYFIPFHDENGILRITLKSDDLIYLEASDNYVVIYYQAAENVKSYLLRNTLKRLETQLAGFSLVRCHRSFMVNVAHVKMMKREKGVFSLWMNDAGTISIPVSRSYSTAMAKFFKSNTFLQEA